MITIYICHGEWAYLTGLPRLDGIRGYQRPGVKATFGRVDEEGVYYVALAVSRGRPSRTRKDKDGRPIWEPGPFFEAGLEMSPCYADRLFTWGDDAGISLSQEQLIVYMGQLGLGGQGFWEAHNVHRGYKGGLATWYQALMADTHVGSRWYDVQALLERRRLRRLNIPTNWEFEKSEKAEYITIYIDDAAA